jgi:flagellar hook-associated protein 3 FlgL
MLPTTFGDMTRTISLGRQNARLKAALSTLSTEMTTGQAHDRLQHLNGNVSALAAMEQSLDLAAGRKNLAQMTAAFLAAQQSVIGEVMQKTEQLSLDAQRLGLINDAASLGRVTAGMANAFSDVVRLLNASFGERTLFAGTRGDGPALAMPEAILDALMSDIPVPVDPSILASQIDAWFAPGGGFDSFGYLGGPVIPAAISLGHGTEIRLSVTAQDSAIRTALATLATGALLDRSLPGVAEAGKRMIVLQNALPLKAASQALLDLSARLGVAEERAATASSRAEAEHSSLAIARAELLAVDPYDAASKLEQAMSQLEMIYAITARLSRLRLAEYLR